MFVLGHFFFLDMGYGFDMKWAGVTNSFGPTVSKVDFFGKIKQTQFKKIKIRPTNTLKIIKIQTTRSPNH